MTDQLATIGGDRGPIEATPVTIFKSAQNGGTEVDFSSIGGGGSSGGTATAAAPSYTEGATGQPLSLKLNGDLRVTNADEAALLGALTETAPANDTASSGTNGRLQRIAQRLTSLIALVPASLGGKTAAASLAVTLATDEPLLAKIGEVQASPTANTLLDRVKALLTGIILAAGEAHIGKVGGETIVATSVPTVSASPAYTSGDVIGTKMTFAGLGRVTGGTGLVQMASIYCKTAQTFACDLVLFHTDPSTSAFTDNAAMALNAADFDKVLGVVSFTTASWYSLGTPSFAEATQLAMAYKVATGASDIYGVLVARATPTLGSTTDIKVVVKSLLD